MTDPVRLMDQGATDLERALIDSAAEEMPSGALSKRMLVGLTSAAALGAASTTTAYAATKSATALSTIKWGLGGIAALALGWGGYVASQDDATSSDAKNPVSQGSAPRAPQSAERATNGEGTADETNAAAPASMDEAAKGAATIEEPLAPARSPSSRAAASEPDQLRAELSLLDRARSALKNGDADGALSAVSAYERKFPQGALRQEATVLKVEALKARGSAGQADALVEDFLKKNPDSAHKTRLRPSPEKSPAPSE